ncbi:hypothetical protein ANTQUA_LOCUS6953, partial [Anthophora quadrimaculata]
MSKSRQISREKRAIICAFRQEDFNTFNISAGSIVWINFTVQNGYGKRREESENIPKKLRILLYLRYSLLRTRFNRNVRRLVFRLARTPHVNKKGYKRQARDQKGISESVDQLWTNAQCHWRKYTRTLRIV